MNKFEQNKGVASRTPDRTTENRGEKLKEAFLTVKTLMGPRLGEVLDGQTRTFSKPVKEAMTGANGEPLKDRSGNRMVRIKGYEKYVAQFPEKGPDETDKEGRVIRRYPGAFDANANGREIDGVMTGGMRVFRMWKSVEKYDPKKEAKFPDLYRTIPDGKGGEVHLGFDNVPEEDLIKDTPELKTDIAKIGGQLDWKDILRRNGLGEDETALRDLRTMFQNEYGVLPLVAGGPSTGRPGGK